MAATGKTPILLYGSTTATNQPSAGNLTNSSDGCEIAINVADKNLFFKDSTNVVNTVPIRQSSASSNGWLSSTDWSTFNSKQPAGTYVTSVTGTAPVVSSGGTTPAISMAAATGSVNGYLTSTDWNTFNNKVSSQWSTVTNGITYSSNVGVNVNPSAWRSDYKAVTPNDISLYSSTAANDRGLANNCYANSAGDYIYTNSAYASRLILAYNAQLYYQRAVSGTAGNTVSFVNAFIVDDSNNVQVPAGNLVIGTSGKGIDFSATAGTGTSELLADYEEGTWTPSNVNGTSGTITSYTSSGTYTKIGRMVYLDGIITLTDVGTAGGRIYFDGLPYTVGDSMNITGVSREQGATGVMYYAFVIPSGTYGYISASTGGAVTWSNGYAYAFSITYRV